MVGFASLIVDLAVGLYFGTFYLFAYLSPATSEKLMN